MKLNVKDVVVIKTLQELIDEKLIHAHNDMEGVYSDDNNSFHIFDNFPFFGKETTISTIDENDDSIPYFLSCGIWAPEWMLRCEKEYENPEIVNEPNNKPKVWLNKFNNKPFGKLFVKLINIDPKVAEFSSTAFGRLRKHELQYIARLLMNNNAPAIDINAPVGDLASYCYNQTKLLNA